MPSSGSVQWITSMNCFERKLILFVRLLRVYARWGCFVPLPTHSPQPARFSHFSVNNLQPKPGCTNKTRTRLGPKSQSLLDFTLTFTRHFRLIRSIDKTSTLVYYKD